MAKITYSINPYTNDEELPHSPAVTHHCPNCEAAQRELADIAAVLRTGSSGDTLLGKEVSRWIDTAHAAEQELADLRAHPVICGCGDHIGYAERIGLSQDGAICGNCATGRSDYEARTELDTLRARLAAILDEYDHSIDLDAQEAIRALLAQPGAQQEEGEEA